MAILQLRGLCVFCSVALILSTAFTRAQRADDLMDRVGDWVHEFVEQFANVVAEEEYVPALVYRAPRLRSDYLLVRYPGSAGNWLTFRDVVALNGVSLQNQPERLTKLFLGTFDSAVEQANAITKHSARYILPRTDPLLGIAVLQRQYQHRFRYTVRDLDRGRGPGVRRILFEETSTPTILQRDESHDLPTRGTAWVVEATGRVVRTELQIGVPTRREPATQLSTTFKIDESLHIQVPAEMQEGLMFLDSSRIRGQAYYTRFRRFTVRTAETIGTPPQ